MKGEGLGLGCGEENTSLMSVATCDRSATKVCAPSSLYCCLLSLRTATCRSSGALCRKYAINSAFAILQAAHIMGNSGATRPGVMLIRRFMELSCSSTTLLRRAIERPEMTNERRDICFNLLFRPLEGAVLTALGRLRLSPPVPPIHPILVSLRTCYRK